MPLLEASIRRARYFIRLDVNASNLRRPQPRFGGTRRRVRGNDDHLHFSVPICRRSQPTNASVAVVLGASKDVVHVGVMALCIDSYR